MITQLITKEAVTGTARPSTDTASAAKIAVKMRTAVGFSLIERAESTRIEFSCRPRPVRVIIAAMTPAAAHTAATASTPRTPVANAAVQLQRGQAVFAVQVRQHDLHQGGVDDRPDRRNVHRQEHHDHHQ